MDKRAVIHDIELVCYTSISIRTIFSRGVFGSCLFVCLFVALCLRMQTANAIRFWFNLIPIKVNISMPSCCSINITNNTYYWCECLCLFYGLPSKSFYHAFESSCFLCVVPFLTSICNILIKAILYNNHIPPLTTCNSTDTFGVYTCFTWT